MKLINILIKGDIRQTMAHERDVRVNGEIVQHKDF